MATDFPTALDTFVNPTGTTNLDASGGDPRLVHSFQHTNLNDAMVAVQAKLGSSLSSVTTSLDYVTTLLVMTASEHSAGIRRDILGGVFPTNVIWYADLGGIIKVVEKRYTYDSKKRITKVELFLYDGTPMNLVLRTVTDTITRNGIFEVTRIRTVV